MTECRDPEFCQQDGIYQCGCMNRDVMENDDLGERAPEQQAGLDALAKDFFGRTQTEARAAGICVKCGSGRMKPEDFKDGLSRREARITALCQDCQDDLERCFDDEEE